MLFDRYAQQLFAYGHHVVSDPEVVKDAIGADEGDDTNTTSHMRGERGWRQFVDAQVPRAPVLVTVGSRKLLVYTDRGG